MVPKVVHLTFFMLVTVTHAVEWAEVGGTCYGDVAGTVTNCGNRCAQAVPDNSYSFYALSSDVSSAAACRQYCETYDGDRGDGKCYGVKFPIPWREGSQEWSPCEIWTKPVLGSDADASVWGDGVCKIPFGSVISVQMQFEGVKPALGEVDAVDRKIEDVIRKKLLETYDVSVPKVWDVPEHHVSVQSAMSHSLVKGRVRLPVGTNPQQALTKAAGLGPAMEKVLKENNAITTVVSMPGQELKLAKYDAWLWGNQTADEKEVNGAMGTFSVPSSLMALIGLLMCSAAAI